jgi:protein SCO1
VNKRQFVKNLAGASIGLTIAQTLPAATQAPVNSVDTVGLDRRRSRFPNVPVATHEGKIVRFYDDLLKDRTVLINFMYARCGDFCPGMTANLKKVRAALGDRVGKDIFMYSVSLEPEHDTLEHLKHYAELFKTGPGWQFLTGRKADIEQIRRALGFVNSDPVLDKDKTQHIGVVKYGIEKLERWGACPALTRAEAIADNLLWLEPKGKMPSLSLMRGRLEEAPAA